MPLKSRTLALMEPVPSNRQKRRQRAAVSTRMPVTAPQSGPNFYLEVLESLWDYAVFTMTPDGRVSSWNRGAERIFLYKAEEIIGKPAGLIFTPEDIDAGGPKEEMDQALRNGSALDERWHVRRGGAVFWGSGRMFALRDGRQRHVGFTKIVQDLTERRRKDEATRQAKEMLEFITDRLPAVIAYVDSDLRFQLANQRVEHWFGHGRSEIIGRGVLEVIGSDALEVVRPEIKRVLAGETVAAERKVKMADDERWVQVDYVPDFAADGRLKGFVWFMVDITAVKEAQQALSSAKEDLTRQAAGLEAEVSRRTERLSELNKELESFTYSASHDLRSPLRKIDAFSSEVIEHCGQKMDESCLRHMARVQEAIGRMHRLIDDMLTLARVTQRPLELGDVDLSALAEEIAADLARERPREGLVVKIQPGLSATGDRNLCRIALDNLIDNSWKFTAKTPSPRIEVGETEDGGTRAFYVRDNGAGFEMEGAPRMFEAFERLHRQEEFPGTGVGLAIARRAVERQKGRIWAEGAVGRGATVYFTLPPAGAR